MTFQIFNNSIEPIDPDKEKTHEKPQIKPNEKFQEKELEIHTEQLHLQTEVDFESIELKPAPTNPKTKQE